MSAQLQTASNESSCRLQLVSGDNGAFGFVFGSAEVQNVILVGIMCLLGASYVTRLAFMKLWRSCGETDPTKVFDCMGEIEGLHDLNVQDVKPRRIYKFANKYNLTMGLRKTSINTITQMDMQYCERIEERKKILNQYPGALGCMAPATETVNELYTFLFTHYLPKRYPTIFQTHLETATLENRLLNTHAPLHPPKNAPLTALRHIALSVDEDFLMLLPAPDGDGYSLQAFVWLYPVGFDPQHKLGVKLRDAHAPVPGYRQHLQHSMDRYFGRLEPGRVVERVNWAVATRAALCERGEYHLYSDDAAPRDVRVDLEDTWVRCELQTLFALPRTGARVLSVHLYMYPLSEIRDVGLAEDMCRAVDGLALGNAGGFSRYKRVPVWGEKVKGFLRGELVEGGKRGEGDGEDQGDGEVLDKQADMHTVQGSLS